MQNCQPAKLLWLHLTEGDRYQGRPLHEAVVEKCREMKMAGATVFQASEGFDDTGEIHRAHLLTHDLPLVVQIVDTEENIARLLPVVEPMIGNGLIAISDVEIRRIRKAAVSG